jgi:hypothetical protein
MITISVRDERYRYVVELPAHVVVRLGRRWLGALDGGVEPSTTLWVTEHSLIRAALRGDHGLRLVSVAPLWPGREAPDRGGCYVPLGGVAESL